MKEKFDPTSLDFEPAFEFVPEEDDDWREGGDLTIEPEILTGVGDWVQPIDAYNARGADFGQIQTVKGFNLEVAWISDAIVTSVFIDDVRPIDSPTVAQVDRVKASRLTALPSACPDRIDPRPSAPFHLGDLVMARSILCRHGVQLGVVTEILPADRYRVQWQHIVGSRAKDSRTSWCPDSWRRGQLLSAESSWHQFAKAQKRLKGAEAQGRRRK